MIGIFWLNIYIHYCINLRNLVCLFSPSSFLTSQPVIMEDFSPPSIKLTTDPSKPIECTKGSDGVFRGKIHQSDKCVIFNTDKCVCVNIYDSSAYGTRYPFVTTINGTDCQFTYAPNHHPKHYNDGRILYTDSGVDVLSFVVTITYYSCNVTDNAITYTPVREFSVPYELTFSS